MIGCRSCLAVKTGVPCIHAGSVFFAQHDSKDDAFMGPTDIADQSGSTLSASRHVFLAIDIGRRRLLSEVVTLRNSETGIQCLYCAAR